MELEKHLATKVGFADDLIRTLDTLFIRKQYSKGHQLLERDNLSRKVFFIEQGLARTYYLKDTKDITHLFFAEGSFCVAVESVFFATPSPYGLELLENAVVRTASYDTLQEALGNDSRFQKLTVTLAFDALKVFSDRLTSMQFQSAQERYQSLITSHPDILLRAPLGHIASFLGITQQTLSVIRAGKS